eukprot:10161360-Alexandrium_andersonii.AAC.1
MAPQSKLGRAARPSAGALRSDSEVPPVERELRNDAREEVRDEVVEQEERGHPGDRREPVLEAVADEERGVV